MIKIFKVISKNEVSSSKKIALNWGLSSGKSGLSFGWIQEDIKHNSSANNFIRTWFSKQELETLSTIYFSNKKEDLNFKRLMNLRLESLELQIFKRQMKILNDDINYIQNLKGLEFLKEKELALAFAVDYHNQFFVSKNGKFHNTWANKSSEYFLENFLNWKLTKIFWGRKNPADVNRRYLNTLEVFS